MDPKADKPLRLFVNPFSMWTDLALKTGEAMLASAHAAALTAARPKVGVIPTADAPPVNAEPPKAEAPTKAEAPKTEAPRARPKIVRHASKATRFKASKAKLRSKANAKRRSRH